MSSVDDLQDFESSDLAEFSSTNFSELQCEQTGHTDDLLTDVSEEENMFFSSVHELAEDDVLQNDSSQDECREHNNHDAQDDSDFDNADISSLSIDLSDKEVNSSTDVNYNKKTKLATNDTFAETDSKIIETEFKTGKNETIKVAKKVFDIQAAFSPVHTKMPMRKYLCPEKGHVTTEMEEKTRYYETFYKLKSDYKKVSAKLLLIQYRWAWVDLYLSNELNDTTETYRLLKMNVETRLRNKYSILERIVEGDEVASRYMILMVLSLNKNIAEVYDGYFNVFIELDDLLTRYCEWKKVSLGYKIKLFGCKYLLTRHMSILEYDGHTPVMKAFYNSFGFALPNRKVGYRKSLSFVKTIECIKREGGVISCIRGTVKKIVESRYIIQIKDYRSIVDNIEEEIERIQEEVLKNNEQVSVEDIKVRKYLNFIFADDTSECLITAWQAAEDICKGSKMIFYGLVPVMRSMGVHLSTTRQTRFDFIK